MRANGSIPSKTVEQVWSSNQIAECPESKGEKPKTVIPESSDESEVEDVLFDDDDDFNKMVDDIIPENKVPTKQTFKFQAVGRLQRTTKTGEPGTPKSGDSKGKTLASKLSKLSSKKRPIQYADSDEDFE